MKNLILLFILSSFVSVFAGTYYIDYDSGSDARAGTSITTAWKHCPGDTKATSNPQNVTTLSAGSTLIFKGGTTYVGQINVISSGTSGGSIVYDGNSSGTWGTGKAILSGNGVNNGTGFSLTSQNYVTIQNFEICHYGDYTAAQLASYNCTSNPLPDIDGTGLQLQNVTYVTIQNCYFHEIGIWQNTSPVNGDNDISGTGIMAYSGNHITITNNEFTKMSQPINLSTDGNSTSLTQVTVSYNNIHDYIRWLICVGAGGNNSTMQDINIFNNSLHDYPEYDGSIENFCLNNTDEPHDDGIIFLVATSDEAGTQSYKNCVLGTPAHPIQIYNNSFYNDNTTSGGGTAYIFLTQWGGTVYMYNNLFLYSHPQDLGGEGDIYAQDGLLASDNNPAVDYHIWNNTFFDNYPAIWIRSMTPGYDFNRPGYTIDIRNNLMNLAYTTDTLCWGNNLVVLEADNSDSVTPSLPTTMDYNWYAICNANGQYLSTLPDQLINVGTDNNSYSYTVSQWDSKYKIFEAHGNFGNPYFVNISYGLFDSVTLNNFNLQQTSQATAAGANLSSYFATDILGNQRTTWGVGAYSPIITGTLPTLASPINGATNQPISPTLSWGTVTGSTSYNLLVSTSSGFTTTVSSQTGITGLSASVSSLANSTPYYWEVNARNGTGTGAWSSVWRFTTIIAPPLAPMLASPPNNAVNQSTSPTLSWGTVTGSASYGVQVSTVTTFASMVSNQSSLVATFSTVSGLSNSITYYWRANATNAGGTSAWSSAWGFTTTAIPGLGAPVLALPSNNAVNQSTSPTLSWNTVTGAGTYTVLVSSASNFGSTVSSQMGLTGLSTSVSGLSNNTSYYWEVSATNAGGTSAWSSMWSFTTINQGHRHERGIQGDESLCGIESKYAIVTWYDLRGNLIKQIINNKYEQGHHVVSCMTRLAPGVYIVKMKTDDFEKVIRVIRE